MSKPIAPGPQLDPEALYIALDKKRRAERLSWRAVSGQAGVGIFTAPRLGRGNDVHASTLIRLMVWLGVTDITPFVNATTTAAAGGGQDGDEEGQPC